MYLYQAFRERGKLFLVFEYLEKTVLDDLELAPDGLEPEYIKTILYQLLLASSFMHKNRIIHRDIKPENLLLSTNGLLKVCDFGFARQLNDEDKFYLYTDYVSTRWYRAPELLVGDAAYDETVDVWAVGCIVAELFSGQPLFPGDSDLHTLQLILEAQGNGLTEKQKSAFLKNEIFEGHEIPYRESAPSSEDSSMQGAYLSPLEAMGMPEDMYDFMISCLHLDPEKRSKAHELINHRFFGEDYDIEY